MTSRPMPRHFCAAALLVLALAGADVAHAQTPPGPPAPPVVPLPGTVPPLAPPPDGRLVQVSADVLEQSIEGGKRVQRLSGNVVLVQETTTITAERARRVLDDGVAYLSGRVRVIQLGDTLDAPEVRYDEASRVGVATGGIRLANEDAVVRAPSVTYDTGARRAVLPDPLRLSERTGGAVLSAPRAVYFSDARRADLDGGLRLVDSSVVMTARKGAYYLDERRAEFEGDVRLVDSTSTLTALRGVYYRESERAVFEGDVRLEDSTGVLTAPSVVYFRREAQAVFEDGVRLTDSTSVLTARSGVYLRREQQAGFIGDVRLVRRETQPSGAWALDRLAADTLTYLREARRATARSRVTLVRDEADASGTVRTRAVLLADLARDDARAGTSRADRVGRGAAPLFVRVTLDSLGAPTDTLALVADRLDLARDSLRQTLRARGDVRLAGREFAAAADSASVLRLDPDGAAPRDDARFFSFALPPAPADTASTARDAPRRGGSRPAPAATAAPPASTGSPAPSTGSPAPSTGSPPSSTAARVESTAAAVGGTGRQPVAFLRRAQVTADSLRLTAFDGEADSLFATGRAFVADEDSLTGRLHQARGETLVGVFAPGSDGAAGTRRTFTLGPNAEVLRWLATPDGARDGAITATADRVVVETDGDRLRRFDAFDGIEGTQYAENLVPVGLALAGLAWMPARRPTFAALTAGRRLPSLVPLRRAPGAVPAGPPDVDADDLDPETSAVRPVRDRGGR